MFSGPRIPNTSRRFPLQSTKKESPTLSVWHSAVAKVPPNRLLPRTDRRNQKMEAYLGDKLLGVAFAKWILRQKKDSPANSDCHDVQEFLHDQGSATRLGGLILSNKFMADRFSIILPDPIFKDWASNSGRNSSSVLGSIVEAAVAVVDDSEAVDDLIEWLISQGREVEMINAKGKLLEMGGTITVKRRGGSDCAPVFVAKAKLAGASAAALGASKRVAEQSAASKCLVQLGCCKVNCSEEIHHPCAPSSS